MAAEQAQQQQLKKDPMISFKSVRAGQDKRGDDRIELSMNQETASALYDALGTMLNNERGVKLDVHYGERETNDGSRTFLSGYAFVKEIQEFGSVRPGPNAGGRFKNTADVKNRIKDAKSKITDSE